MPCNNHKFLFTQKIAGNLYKKTQKQLTFEGQTMPLKNELFSSFSASSNARNSGPA